MTQVDTGESIEQLKERLADEGVRYVFGVFVDAHGVPKSKCVPLGHLDSMASGSELYTVGALEGMGELGPHEDECTGLPDMRGVTVLPWDRRYAVAFADLELHGVPYTHDSRGVLKRQMREAEELGYRFNMGVEPELFVLRDADGEWRPWVDEDVVNRPTRGYDVETTMLADRFLEPMVEYMDGLGWDVYSFDHEGGDGQYEFDFRYCDGLQMADRMVVFRLMAKHVARTLGCVASFMPKPYSDSFGSGAHINMSLADLATGEDAFRAGADDAPGARHRGYTDIAYHFTAGVLRHGRAITALACPTVNSYKRLLPRGYMQEITWAPVFRAWGENNRTLMCRLPANRFCVELRTADSACNFYLAAGLTLAAGLEGIRERLEPGDPVNVDTYKLSDDELRIAGLERLPRTLGEALDAFARDDLARDVLGEEFHRSFLELKGAEWDAYNTAVMEWERDQYLRLW